MHVLVSIIKNMAMVLLILAVMLFGLYALLLVLQAMLKLKSGRSEEEGLTDLWLESGVVKQADPPED
ncbi:MAG: hypothetical protein VR64_05725 [Desulfatitalea sp. BRH_c12]|nr:MAG: hypothetical protein VR64_05725 [Desulfatitalea sp. BRH_c12]